MPPIQTISASSIRNFRNHMTGKYSWYKKHEPRISAKYANHLNKFQFDSC